MAPNKFATSVHRETNRIVLVLIYACLEWTLIILVLLNSLFSYLIFKFADYFGLIPPCSWCSRIDHFFEQGENRNQHRDHLCEAHAKEISRLGYCLNHRKLAVSNDMCENCSSNGFNSIPILKQFGMFQTEILRDGEGFKCSCCGANMEKISGNPSWDFLEYMGKENLIFEVKTDDVDKIRSDVFEIKRENRVLSTIYEDFEASEQVKEADDSSVSEIKLGLKEFEDFEDEQYLVCNDQIPNEIMSLNVYKEEESREIYNQDLEFFIDCSGHQLVPIELFDSPEEEKDEIRCRTGEYEENQAQFEKTEEHKWSVWGTEEQIIPVHLEINEHKFAEFISMEVKETDNSLVFHCGPSPHIDDSQEIQEKISSVFEEASQLQKNETEHTDVSTGTEIPVLDLMFENQVKKSPFSDSFLRDDDHGNKEVQEERFPETPTSSDNLNHSYNKLLLPERKEYAGEEYIDGSVISDIEGGEGVLTVERLTSVLRSERKALNDLYAELEEERNASAVAANQTMAMITRLQEEKAAMQMEALQYQRMMEEQTEYDQEAVQILNELMVKREKEKQELERELDLYRKRVSDYEAREKFRILRRSGGTASVTSCASFSNAEDSDELLLDLNQETKEEDQESENQNTPVDAILNMGDPLSDFEEERILILEQLKQLEEKLLTLSDAEEQYFEGIRPIHDDFYKENGESDSDDHEVIINGFRKETNGKHLPRKRLLPLFDAISTESEDGEYINGHENGSQISSIGRLELVSKRVAIEEEVDQVYERLQALEADRSFLRNCISSLKKGDKGMDLLQQILQHLRDLRDIEIRSRNSSDGSSL